MEKDSTDKRSDDTSTETSSAMTYHATHDASDSKTLSLTVIEALSDVQGISPVEMEQPLYDVIDPDALDCLFTADGADGRLVFTISGHEVSVTASGDVFVRERL